MSPTLKRKEREMLSSARHRSLHLALDITYISSILLPQTHDPIISKNKRLGLGWVCEENLPPAVLFF